MYVCVRVNPACAAEPNDELAEIVECFFSCPDWPLIVQQTYPGVGMAEASDCCGHAIMNICSCGFTSVYMTFMSVDLFHLLICVLFVCLYVF